VDDWPDHGANLRGRHQLCQDCGGSPRLTPPLGLGEAHREPEEPVTHERPRIDHGGICRPNFYAHHSLTFERSARTCWSSGSPRPAT